MRSWRHSTSCKGWEANLPDPYYCGGTRAKYFHAKFLPIFNRSDQDLVALTAREPKWTNDANLISAHFARAAVLLADVHPEFWAVFELENSRLGLGLDDVDSDEEIRIE